MALGLGFRVLKFKLVDFGLTGSSLSCSIELKARGFSGVGLATCNSVFGVRASMLA